MKTIALILSAAALITGCATTKGLEVSADVPRSAPKLAARRGLSASFKAWRSTSSAWA